MNCNKSIALEAAGIAVKNMTPLDDLGYLQLSCQFLLVWEIPVYSKYHQFGVASVASIGRAPHS
jgi:hypothetical protein